MEHLIFVPLYCLLKLPYVLDKVIGWLPLAAILILKKTISREE